MIRKRNDGVKVGLARFSNESGLRSIGKGNFLENAVNIKTKDKANFFNLGPKNDYIKLLDKNIQHKIEKKFEKTMKKLNYL